MCLEDGAKNRVKFDGRRNVTEANLTAQRC
jgi:hypothetical protein